MIPGMNGSQLDLSALPFGIRHKLVRTLLDLRIEDAVKGLQVNEYTVTRWEKHGVSPYKKTLQRVVDFYATLGIPAEVWS